MGEWELGAVTGGVAVVLVVDGVVQQDGHEGATVGSVPPRHSKLLIHLLQLQQLKRRGREETSCHSNSIMQYHARTTHAALPCPYHVESSKINLGSPQLFPTKVLVTGLLWFFTHCRGNQTVAQGAATNICCLHLQKHHNTHRAGVGVSQSIEPHLTTSRPCVESLA